MAKQLSKRGHKIIVQNWRHPRCEIDIVSSENQIVYLTEVKYCSSATQGEGFEYITSVKRRQMELAAQIWIVENDWSGECQLLAASVSGEDYSQVDIVEV